MHHLVMTSKISLRHDQFINETNNTNYKDETVMIVAPEWVESGLDLLSQFIPIGSQFSIIDTKGKNKMFVIKDALNLKELVMIARNEPLNTSGKIKFTYYEPLITDKAIIYSIKDLARQCVIVGMDETTHFGGFNSSQVKQKKGVIIIDLIGLQFQTEYNTGRLVLIGKDLPKGILDEIIFENIVGEKKKSFEQVIGDKSDRYVKTIEEDVYFDSYAYKKFISNDVFVSGLAVNQFFLDNKLMNKLINFKFLKYGTGFYAGNYRDILETYIYDGIVDGLDKLFATKANQCIKLVEFPFYNYKRNIASICQSYGIECKFSKDDSLKQTDEYMTATTNCADAHAITGNAMGMSSVDASIASNLKSKGNKFSPIFNPLMKERFLQVMENMENPEGDSLSSQGGNANSKPGGIPAKPKDQKLNKEDIGEPSNFEHTVHVGVGKMIFNEQTEAINQSLKETFKNLDKSKPNYDITFIIDNQILKANKTKLSEKSKVFNDMFFGDFKNNYGDEISIKNTSYKAFKSMIKYINFEHIDDLSENYSLAMEIYSIGQRFKLDQLTREIEFKLTMMVSIDSITDLYAFSVKNDTKLLIMELRGFIENFINKLSDQSMDTIIKVNSGTDNSVLKKLVFDRTLSKTIDDHFNN